MDTKRDIWSFLGLFYKQVGSFSRGLKIARLYKRNDSGRVTHATWETFTARACFPNVSQFPMRETLLPVSALVSKIQIMLTPHSREF